VYTAVSISFEFLKGTDFSGALAIFAFLDFSWMPAAIALDVRFRIQNETVADFLSLSGEHAAIEVFDFGWFELLIWSLQALVAIWLADKLPA
jgi:hypothetical protein